VSEANAQAEPAEADEPHAHGRPDALVAGFVETTIRRPDRPERSLPTAIWYPARASEAAGPAAAHPLGLPHEARPGLPPIDGPCPLIVFSHGNSGYRQQSTFLTTRLAEAGFVVAAPDHIGNTFPEMLALANDEERATRHREIRSHRPADLHAVLASLLSGEAPASASGPRLRLPALDPMRAGALGHSFGGWTALKQPALDPRVRAVCSLAPVAEPFVGRGAFGPQDLPLPNGVRALVIAARDDVLVDLETSLLPLFERLGPGASLEILDDADHFHFCDGIELLHRMHENNPRPGQRRPTRPFRELRGERPTQTLLADLAVAFFTRTLRRGPAA